MSSWLRQWPSSPQPLPSGPLLTFMGVGSPQLHHRQVAGGGGVEGEVRGQGYRASLRRGRGPHPAGDKAAQEGLACREKGGVPVRQPAKQVVTPGPPSQGPLLHESFTVRNQKAFIPWPAWATSYGPNHHSNQGRQRGFPQAEHPSIPQKSFTTLAADASLSPVGNGSRGPQGPSRGPTE